MRYNPDTMSDILSDLLSHIDPSTVGQIASQLGVDEGTAQQGIQAALPLLLGGLARNTESEGGADALSNALNTGGHDGSILENLAGAVLGGGQGGVGGAILGHIFGGQQQSVTGAVGQQMGGANGAMLLQILAPIVMGYLGKQQQSQGLDASGLAGLLGGHQQSVAQSGGGAMGMIGQLLDGNHDGSPLDDIIGMAGKFLGGR